MHIKSIKINGFKSFADKVNIELDKGFTGIVGPNGSGKSNVVDAVKWVLGEQSVKSLRGSNSMTDVIFTGSKSRGASNHASVTIIFDNTDKSLPVEYDEISIKRVVYKSGDNEYLLNGERVRLKDITDLLVDSFSSKESFNIIPQNKIEEILSEKPEDRRVIFEEAAGVLKYKHRKIESLRKLEKTHENIDRIDMIINELSENLAPLQRDSLKAIEYKEAKERLENIEVGLLAKDITFYSENLTEKKLEKERVDNEIASSSKDSTESGVKLEKYKLKSIKLDEEINELQKKLMQLNESLAETNNKKSLLQERTKYDKNSDVIKNNVMELKEVEGKLTVDIKSYNVEIDSLEETEKSILKKLESLNSEMNSLNSKKSISENDMLNKRRKEIEVKNKLNFLENNISSLSKVPFSVKAVMDNPSLKGIHNIIGNIIEFKNEHATAIDISLGASSNFIITESTKDAEDAIFYLKNNNKGRATFFPINVIRPRAIEPNILDIVKNEIGFVGIASDLVTYDKKYYNIIMNQLGNIIVATDINTASNIAKATNFKYRVVSLDGELVHVGGSLTGGSNKNSSSVIADKYEFERLTIFLGALEKEINELNLSFTKYEEETNIIREQIYSLNIELVKSKEQIYSKQNSLDELLNKHLEIKEEIKSISAKGNTYIDSELENVMKESVKLESNKVEVNSKLETSRKEKEELRELINDLEEAIRKENKESSDLLNNSNKLEIEIVKYNMMLDNMLNRLNDEYSLTYERAKEKYLLEIDENEAREIVNELKKKIKSLGEVNLGSIEEYERVNKRYTFLTSQKEDLMASEQNLLQIITEMDDVMIDKFASTFEKINKEFNKVFSNLFGGGEAHLKLTDPTNILETGIEIVAIPSGKNLKPISLLSGGEKTLTAISLLFSIMNLKNVPFVILDEVESALDEANAERFGEYIQNYRNKTQLLLITHKKKTMEYLDLLYGVTMQESGVSKLVSVKLED